MKSLWTCLAGLLLLGGCRMPLYGHWETSGLSPQKVSTSVAPGAPVLGAGAAPGNAKGPGGFVPRGSMRNFYAGKGGRLWYYMNNYYWVSDTAPREDLWIKAVVVEEFQDLRRWPDGNSVSGPEPKTTVEYWEVAPSGRTVWVDNHRDYCLLSDKYTAGAIVVDITLTLGHLEVQDERSKWGAPEAPYVLEVRNYGRDRGIGAARARFKPLSTEAETVWSYRIPWSTHPQRLTRSNWKRMKVPSWEYRERRPPPRPAAEHEPVVTPTASAAKE